MKVLFIMSGNSGAASPIIFAQSTSLSQHGLRVDHFLIRGKGAIGYIKSIPPLLKHMKYNDYSLMHAHYAFCGFVAFLSKLFLPKSKKLPVVCSLMGSDVKGGQPWQALIRFLAVYGWDATIVKSGDMKQCLGVGSSRVLPNGVDLNMFVYNPSQESKLKLGWKMENKHILFGADSHKPVKNYPLAREAYTMLNADNCELHTLGSIPHADIPLYLNACDVLLLSSKWEGSPNIVKEAMACGTPIVCTDVGDVRWLLEGVEGCYICSSDPVDIAKKLDLALKHNVKTNGRDRLIELGLDADSVASRIVSMYEEVLKRTGI